MSGLRAYLNLLLPAAAIALAVSVQTAELSAQALPTDRAYLQFGQPVRVPGVTLAPGTYLFVLGTPVGGQSVIDIYSADATKLIASCLGVQSMMPRPADVTILDFPSASPAAARAWFHPGNAIGFEFVYSAAEAKMLFLQSGVAVPYSNFKTVNRDMVGAFPVTLAGAPAPGGPQPVGTVAVAATFDESLDAHGHLNAARRVIANHIPKVVGVEHARLVILLKQVEELQKAYRTKPKDVDTWLSIVHRSLGNMLPNQQKLTANYSEAERTDTATVMVIERVRAHVRAFTRVQGSTAQRASNRR